MKLEAHIHPCDTRLERDLAHTIIAMVPRLGATKLFELGERMEENVRDTRIVFSHERESLALYFNGRSFITFTRQGPK